MKHLCLLLLVFLFGACANDPTEKEQQSVEETRTAGVENSDQGILSPDQASQQSDMATDDQSTPNPSGEPEHAFKSDFRKEQYGKLIKGEWKLSEADYKRIVLEEGKFQYFEGTESKINEPYSISVNCANTSCMEKHDGKIPLAWCIVTASDCYAIIAANSKELRMIRATDQKTLTYHR